MDERTNLYRIIGCLLALVIVLLFALLVKEDSMPNCGSCAIAYMEFEEQLEHLTSCGITSISYSEYEERFMGFGRICIENGFCKSDFISMEDCFYNS